VLGRMRCRLMRRAVACALLLSAVRAATTDAAECAADGGLACAASSLTTTLDESYMPRAVLEEAQSTDVQTFVSGLYRALHRCATPRVRHGGLKACSGLGLTNGVRGGDYSVPELKYEEHRTAELVRTAHCQTPRVSVPFGALSVVHAEGERLRVQIAAELTALGVSFEKGLAGGTGIVATIGKGCAPRVCFLRVWGGTRRPARESAVQGRNAARMQLRIRGVHKG